MMLGYVNLPGETADYFDSDGYGRTGDLGYYDENGDLFYVDRLKAIMKCVVELYLITLLPCIKEDKTTEMQ